MKKHNCFLYSFAGLIVAAFALVLIAQLGPVEGADLIITSDTDATGDASYGDAWVDSTYWMNEWDIWIDGDLVINATGSWDGNASSSLRVNGSVTVQSSGVLSLSGGVLLTIDGGDLVTDGTFITDTDAKIYLMNGATYTMNQDITINWLSLYDDDTVWNCSGYNLSTNYLRIGDAAYSESVEFHCGSGRVDIGQRAGRPTYPLYLLSGHFYGDDSDLLFWSLISYSSLTFSSKDTYFNGRNAGSSVIIHHQAGSIFPNGGRVILNGTYAGYLYGSQEFYNLVVDRPATTIQDHPTSGAPTVTIENDLTILNGDLVLRYQAATNLQCSGDVTLYNSSTLDLGNDNDHSIGSIYTYDTSTFTSTMSVLTISSESVAYGLFSAGTTTWDAKGGTTRFTGTAEPYVRTQGGNLFDVEVTDNLKFVLSTTIDGDLTIDAGTARTSADAYGITVLGDVVLNGGTLGHSTCSAAFIFDSIEIYSGATFWFSTTTTTIVGEFQATNHGFYAAIGSTVEGNGGTLIMDAPGTPEVTERGIGSIHHLQIHDYCSWVYSLSITGDLTLNDWFKEATDHTLTIGDDIVVNNGGMLFGSGWTAGVSCDDIVIESGGQIRATSGRITAQTMTNNAGASAWTHNEGELYLTTTTTTSQLFNSAVFWDVTLTGAGRHKFPTANDEVWIENNLDVTFVTGKYLEIYSTELRLGSESQAATVTGDCYFYTNGAASQYVELWGVSQDYPAVISMGQGGNGKSIDMWYYTSLKWVTIQHQILFNDATKTLRIDGDSTIEDLNLGASDILNQQGYHLTITGLFIPDGTYSHSTTAKLTIESGGNYTMVRDSTYRKIFLGGDLLMGGYNLTLSDRLQINSTGNMWCESGNLTVADGYGVSSYYNVENKGDFYGGSGYHLFGNLFLYQGNYQFTSGTTEINYRNPSSYMAIRWWSFISMDHNRGTVLFSSTTVSQQRLYSADMNKVLTLFDVIVSTGSLKSVQMYSTSTSYCKVSIENNLVIQSGSIMSAIGPPDGKFAFDVGGGVLVNGTLDLSISDTDHSFRSLTINSPGVFSSTPATLSLTGNGVHRETVFHNDAGSGGYIHNNGTLATACTDYYYTYMGDAILYDVDTSGSGNGHYAFFWEDFTIENSVDSSNEGFNIYGTAWAGAASSSCVWDAGSEDIHIYTGNFYGVDDDYPVQVTARYLQTTSSSSQIKNVDLTGTLLPSSGDKWLMTGDVSCTSAWVVGELRLNGNTLTIDGGVLTTTGTFITDTDATMYLMNGATYTMSQDVHLENLYVYHSGTIWDCGGYNLSVEYLRTGAGYYSETCAFYCGSGKILIGQESKGNGYALRHQSGTFHGNNSNLVIASILSYDDFYLSSETTYFNGLDWGGGRIINSFVGNWYHQNGRVVFNETQTRSYPIIGTGATFYDVVMNNTMGTIIVMDCSEFEVENDLTILNGHLDCGASSAYMTVGEHVRLYNSSTLDLSNDNTHSMEYLLTYDTSTFSAPTSGGELLINTIGSSWQTAIYLGASTTFNHNNGLLHLDTHTEVNLQFNGHAIYKYTDNSSTLSINFQDSIQVIKELYQIGRSGGSNYLGGGTKTFGDASTSCTWWHSGLFTTTATTTFQSYSEEFKVIEIGSGRSTAYVTVNLKWLDCPGLGFYDSGINIDVIFLGDCTIGDIDWDHSSVNIVDVNGFNVTMGDLSIGPSVDLFIGGGNLYVDDITQENDWVTDGNLTVNGTGSFQALTVSTGNTLDATISTSMTVHGHFITESGSTLKAPSGMLEATTGDTTFNSGTYIHNSGTFKRTGGSGDNLVADGTVFYNLIHNAHTSYYSGSFTIENSWSSIYGRMWFYTGTVTLGTTTNSCTVLLGSDDISFAGNGYTRTFQAASEEYYAIITGNDFVWNLVARLNCHWNLKWLNFAVSVVTTSTYPTTITLMGDCDFQDITIGTDNVLDMNGFDIAAFGDVVIETGATFSLGGGYFLGYDSLSIADDWGSSGDEADGMIQTQDGITFEKNVTIPSGSTLDLQGNTIVTCDRLRIDTGGIFRAPSGTLGISEVLNNQGGLEGFIHNGGTVRADSGGPSGFTETYGPIVFYNFYAPTAYKIRTGDHYFENSLAATGGYFYGGGGIKYFGTDTSSGSVDISTSGHRLPMSIYAMNENFPTVWTGRYWDVGSSFGLRWVMADIPFSTIAGTVTIYGDSTFTQNTFINEGHGFDLNGYRATFNGTFTSAGILTTGGSSSIMLTESGSWTANQNITLHEFEVDGLVEVSASAGCKNITFTGPGFTNSTGTINVTGSYGDLVYITGTPYWEINADAIDYFWKYVNVSHGYNTGSSALVALGEGFDLLGPWDFQAPLITPHIITEGLFVDTRYTSTLQLDWTAEDMSYLYALNITISDYLGSIIFTREIDESTFGVTAAYRWNISVSIGNLTYGRLLINYTASDAHNSPASQKARKNADSMLCDLDGELVGHPSGKDKSDKLETNTIKFKKAGPFVSDLFDIEFLTDKKGSQHVVKWTGDNFKMSHWVKLDHGTSVPMRITADSIEHIPSSEFGAAHFLINGEYFYDASDFEATGGKILLLDQGTLEGKEYVTISFTHPDWKKGGGWGLIDPLTGAINSRSEFYNISVGTIPEVVIPKDNAKLPGDSTSTTLKIRVYGAGSFEGTVHFYNESGVLLGSQTNVTNNTVAMVELTDLGTNTLYPWYTILSVGGENFTSPLWSFRTGGLEAKSAAPGSGRERYGDSATDPPDMTTIAFFIIFITLIVLLMKLWIGGEVNKS
jgi:hypothetical protein